MDNIYILDVGGVGYEVALYNFYSVGEEAVILVHTQVKEDEISLWGFEDNESLQLFRLLIQVSGVGAKTAFLLLHSKGPEVIVKAIGEKDTENLRVKGIGKKTAQKIILDLSNKIDNLVIDTSSAVLIEKEVSDALQSLGYRQRDIESAIKNLPEDKVRNASTQELIKLLLSVL